jgi:hypothetical protein
MRIWKFCCQVELEIAVVRNVLITQSQQPLLSFFHQLFAQNRLQRGIQLLLNIFHQHCLAVSDSIFKDFQEVRF